MARGADRLRRGARFTGSLLKRILIEERPSITGAPGVAVHSGNTRFALRGRREGGRTTTVIWAVIDDNRVVGANRWSYGFREMIKREPGYGGWRVRSDPGALNSNVIGRAYNFIEVGNDGQGVEGNGVNVDNLPATFTVRPLPNGIVVPIFILSFTIGSPPGVQFLHEPWIFPFPSPIDGICEQPPPSPARRRTTL